MKLRISTLLMVVFISVACIGRAGAAVKTLEGETFQVFYDVSWSREHLDSTDIAVVAPEGTTVHMPIMNFSVKVTPTQVIIFDFAGTGKWGDSVFSGLSIYTSGFLGLATLDIQSGMRDLVYARRITTAGGYLSINWASLEFTPETQVIINIGQVPEPSTYALLIGGLTFLMIRRKVTSTQI